MDAIFPSQKSMPALALSLTLPAKLELWFLFHDEAKFKAENPPPR